MHKCFQDVSCCLSTCVDCVTHMFVNLCWLCCTLFTLILCRFYSTFHVNLLLMLHVARIMFESKVFVDCGSIDGYTNVQRGLPYIWCYRKVIVNALKEKKEVIFISNLAWDFIFKIDVRSCDRMLQEACSPFRTWW